MRERDYYPLIKACLENELKGRFNDFYLEVTASKRFNNKLKAKVPTGRDIVFHFLRDAAPDITGFIVKEHSTDFVVVEFKNRVLKLDDIYQTRKYAELFGAIYAVLVSTEEIPEELKRLSGVVYSLLSLPANKTLVMARFDEGTQTLRDWFPRNPFAER